MFVLFIALWLAFSLSWLLSAFWSDRPAKRIGLGAELPYRAVLLVGALVFLLPAHGYRGPLRLWAVNLAEAWVAIGVMLLGFGFCWYARIHLGRLWSATVTTKPEHRLVDSGPYAIVRHPIYTGGLLAILATAAVKGTVLGVIGAALIVVGFWMKARLEERWLSDELGAETYDDYRHRVPMLVPLGPK